MVGSTLSSTLGTTEKRASGKCNCKEGRSTLGRNYFMPETAVSCGEEAGKNFVSLQANERARMKEYQGLKPQKKNR